MQARLAFDATKTPLATILDFIAGFAEKGGLAADEKARLAIVIEELVTNVAKYAYPEGAAAKPASVVLALEGNQLVIEFDDEGRPFDPTHYHAPKLDAPLQDRPEGLVGIHIIQKIADEMTYSRVGNHNRLRLVRAVRG